VDGKTLSLHFCGDHVNGKKNQGKSKIWKMFLFKIAENSKHGNIKLGFYYVHAHAHADTVELL